MLQAYSDFAPIFNDAPVLCWDCIGKRLDGGQRCGGHNMCLVQLWNNDHGTWGEARNLLGHASQQ